MSVDAGKDLFRIGFLTAIEVPDRGFVGGLLVTNHFGRPLEFQCTAPLKPNRTQEILYGPTLVPYVLGDLIGRTLIEKVGVKPHLVLTERSELLELRELVNIPVACVDDVSTDQKAAPVATDAAPIDRATSEPLVAATDAPVAVETPIEVESAAVVTVDTAEPQRLSSGTQATEDTAEPKRLSSGTRNDESAENRGTAGPDGLSLQLGRQLLRFHSGHADDRAIASRGAQLVPNNADLREPFERVREALGETARIGGAR